jgi:hypothetical protein
MNERQKKLLAEIEGGKTVFNAKDNTEAELSAFEVVVSDLQAIEAAGLIVIKTLHQETGSGGRYIDHVKVSVS